MESLCCNRLRKLPSNTYTNPDMQNTNREGFSQVNVVINLCVSVFNSECMNAGINYPGDWDDSGIDEAHGLY